MKLFMNFRLRKDSKPNSMFWSVIRQHFGGQENKFKRESHSQVLHWLICPFSVLGEMGRQLTLQGGTMSWGRCCTPWGTSSTCDSSFWPEDPFGRSRSSLGSGWFSVNKHNTMKLVGSWLEGPINCTGSPQVNIQTRPQLKCCCADHTDHQIKRNYILSKTVRIKQQKQAMHTCKKRRPSWI